jgi:hypothetical protein
MVWVCLGLGLCVDLKFLPRPPKRRVLISRNGEWELRWELAVKVR